MTGIGVKRVDHFAEIRIRRRDRGRNRTPIPYADGELCWKDCVVSKGGNPKIGCESLAGEPASGFKANGLALLMVLPMWCWRLVKERGSGLNLNFAGWPGAITQKHFIAIRTCLIPKTINEWYQTP